MAAYAVFVRDTTTNGAELATYSRQASSTLEGHPVTPLAAYGSYEVLEGPPIEGAVILRFPTMEQAKDWYESPAYREARKHRMAGATYRVFLIQGLG